MRIRWTLRRMMLVIFALGFVCGGAELARRHFWREPEPPEWPWFKGGMNHFEVIYTNMDDVQKGIKPPRTRSVLFYDPKKVPHAKPMQANKPMVDKKQMILVRPASEQTKP